MFCPDTGGPRLSNLPSGCLVFRNRSVASAQCSFILPSTKIHTPIPGTGSSFRQVCLPTSLSQPVVSYFRLPLDPTVRTFLDSCIRIETSFSVVPLPLFLLLLSHLAVWVFDVSSSGGTVPTQAPFSPWSLLPGSHGILLHCSRTP